MKIIFAKKNIKSLPLSFFAFLLIAFAFSSCTKDSDNNAVLSQVRITNSAEASVPQDFFLSNVKVNPSAVAYAQSTGYIVTNIGNSQGQFKNTGTSTVTATLSVTLNPGGYYSVFYLDGGSSLAVTDDRTAPQAGKARVRFINLSSALSSNVDFALHGGAALASSVAYKAASTYYDVDAGATFSLFATGSTTALLDIPATTEAGHIYTVYISGATNATISAHLITEK
ncbi:MAG TPA: DUF4397 domain-containing protein [Mucilaginibacter sp.]|nr:DUF4397 domain-containing protein [Mucilaginibacter sp.]